MQYNHPSGFPFSFYFAVFWKKSSLLIFDRLVLLPIKVFENLSWVVRDTSLSCTIQDDLFSRKTWSASALYIDSLFSRMPIPFHNSFTSVRLAWVATSADTSSFNLEKLCLIWSTKSPNFRSVSLDNLRASAFLRVVSCLAYSYIFTMASRDWVLADSRYSRFVHFSYILVTNYS